MTPPRPQGGTRPYAIGAPFVSLVRHAGGVTTIVPHGELDLASTPVLDKILQDAWDTGVPGLAVDLRRLTLIDSSGLHLLMSWRIHAGDALRLIAGNTHVHDTFAIGDVAAELGLEHDGEDA